MAQLKNYLQKDACPCREHPWSRERLLTCSSARRRTYVTNKVEPIFQDLDTTKLPETVRGRYLLKAPEQLELRQEEEGMGLCKVEESHACTGQVLRVESFTTTTTGFGVRVWALV